MAENVGAARDRTMEMAAAIQLENGDPVQEEGGDDECGSSENDYDDDQLMATETDEPAIKGPLAEYLDELYDAIYEKHDVLSVEMVPGLKPHVHPSPRQQYAAGAAIKASETKLRGLILPEELGDQRALSVLMTIAASGKQESGPSIIIAPVSRCHEWIEKISSYFDESTMPALCLLGEDFVPPLELSEYRVIVTSYRRISFEYKKLSKFGRAVEDCANGNTTQLPTERPVATLLSGVLGRDSARPPGRYLVLEEAQWIKNINTRTYSAIAALRTSMTGCIMMTGSLEGCGFEDTFTILSLIYGHPITSPDRMHLHLNDWKRSPEESRNNAILVGPFLTQLSRMLDVATLRRRQG